MNKNWWFYLLRFTNFLSLNLKLKKTCECMAISMAKWCLFAIFTTSWVLTFKFYINPSINLWCNRNKSNRHANYTIGFWVHWGLKRQEIKLNTKHTMLETIEHATNYNYFHSRSAKKKKNKSLVCFIFCLWVSVCSISIRWLEERVVPYLVLKETWIMFRVYFNVLEKIFFFKSTFVSFF